MAAFAKSWCVSLDFEDPCWRTEETSPIGDAPPNEGGSYVPHRMNS
jgi:hypothetical protein